MPTVSNVSSFRKVTPGVVASAHLASRENRPQVTKKEISLVLKRVAPALGIDGTAYHVLDILLGLVLADDFQPGRRPVVAISNQRLAEYTRRTTRTVTRCLKKLVEAGVLAYRDSPTGRRYVYRGGHGMADQAYGLDFTPSCFNLDAFKAQADAFQRRIKAEQDARRAVTRLSRAIADIVDLEPDAFQPDGAELHSIMTREDLDLFAKAELLERLYARTLDSHEANMEKTDPNMSSAGDIDVSPLFITTPTDSLGSNNKRTCSNEQETKFNSDNGKAVEMALEEEPRGRRTETQPAKPQAVRAAGGRIPQTNLDGVSIGLIQSACSQVQVETGVGFANWTMLCDAAEQLRILIGLSPAGYQHAVERQGRYLAAACLAVVAEKALRDPEQIASPGGYFRAMIDRAGDGKLHLHKSLHGLI